MNGLHANGDRFELCGGLHLTPSGQPVSSRASALAGSSSLRRCLNRWVCSQTPNSCFWPVTVALWRGQSCPEVR